MRFTRTFTKLKDAYDRHPRYIDSGGGTRSGKTYSALQLLVLVAIGDDAPTITSVVSETMPHLKRGAIRDFKEIMSSERLWDEEAWSKSESIYTLPNGSIIEFFSADQPGKVHGPARDRLFLNEAVNVPYEVARQLFVRTRELIVVDYNPTHVFWVHEHIAPRPNCVTIHSTYLDNVDWQTGDSFLSREQVEEIESNRGDKDWWTVYGEGKPGQLEGLVYEFDLIDAMPPRGTDKPQAQKSDEELYADSLTEIQGLDFGFTNDPTARVQIYVDHGRKELYVRERCYRTRMQNRHIVDDLRDDGVGRRTEIYADCAEPKSIADIQDAGYNVIPCDKDAPVRSEKLKFQIQWMKGWRLHVTKDSLDLIQELRNYVWEKDRDGNTTNSPIDKYNHLLDAMRYAVWTKYGRDGGMGQYSISFRKTRKDERRHHH